MACYVAITVSDQGRGITGGEVARPVPQILGGPVRGAGRGHGVGTGHLSGDRGGPRGPHTGRERRPVGLGARFTFTLPTVETGEGGDGDLRFRPACHATGASGSPRQSRCGCWLWTTIPTTCGYVRDTLVKAGYAADCHR